MTVSIEIHQIIDFDIFPDLIIGIVAGLDITNHDKLRRYIKDFKTNFKNPKFVGIRHHIWWDEKIMQR